MLQCHWSHARARGQLGRQRRPALEVQHEVMHVGRVGLHRLDVQDAGAPRPPVQLRQQPTDPCRRRLSPPLPLGSGPRPPRRLPTVLRWVLCFSVRAGCLWRPPLSPQDRGRRGESLHVVVDVENSARGLLQDAAGHRPAFLRAGEQPQVHPVRYVAQLQLEGAGR